MLRLCPGLKEGQIQLPIDKPPGVGSDERLKSLAALDVAKVVLDQPRYPKGRNWIRSTQVNDWVKGKKKLIPLGLRERRLLEMHFDKFEAHFNERLRGGAESKGDNILFWPLNYDRSQHPPVSAMYHRPEEYGFPEQGYTLETESSEERATILSDEYIVFLEP
jgi:hypothetical protein